jgi:hypothetical protein
VTSVATGRTGPLRTGPPRTGRHRTGPLRAGTRGLATLALALLLGLPTAARGDLLERCAPEIGRDCADVVEGRGRIAACLIGERERLSPACRPEVERAGRGLFVPRGVRAVIDPGFRADLPAACDGDAGRFCTDVPRGDGRIFACLYAREPSVSPPCREAVRGTLAGG